MPKKVIRLSTQFSIILTPTYCLQKNFRDTKETTHQEMSLQEQNGVLHLLLSPVVFLERVKYFSSAEGNGHRHRVGCNVIKQGTV